MFCINAGGIFDGFTVSGNEGAWNTERACCHRFNQFKIALKMPNVKSKPPTKLAKW